MGKLIGRLRERAADHRGTVHEGPAVDESHRDQLCRWIGAVPRSIGALPVAPGQRRRSHDALRIPGMAVRGGERPLSSRGSLQLQADGRMTETAQVFLAVPTVDMIRFHAIQSECRFHRWRSIRANSITRFHPQVKVRCGSVLAADASSLSVSFLHIRTLKILWWEAIFGHEQTLTKHIEPHTVAVFHITYLP